MFLSLHIFLLCRKFVTCGTDGDIRIWSTDDTEDPIHNCVGEVAFAVCHKTEKIYVATGNNDIQILSLPDGERDGVLDRYVAPINHITVAKKSQVRLFYFILHLD